MTFIYFQNISQRTSFQKFAKGTSHCIVVFKSWAGGFLARIYRCLQIFFCVLPRPFLTHQTLGVLEILYLVSALTSRGAWREACGPLEMRLLTMNGGYWVRPKYGFSVIPRFWLLFLSLRFPGRKTVAELCWRFCKVAATPLNVLPCFFWGFEDSVFLQEAREG